MSVPTILYVCVRTLSAATAPVPAAITSRWFSVITFTVSQMRLSAVGAPVTIMTPHSRINFTGLTHLSVQVFWEKCVIPASTARQYAMEVASAMPNIPRSNTKIIARSSTILLSVITLMHTRGRRAEPSIFTKPIRADVMMVGMAPRKNPYRYSVVGASSSPFAPSSTAIRGANAIPTAVSTAPANSTYSIVAVKILATPFLSPRPNACAACAVPPPEQMLLTAEKIRLMGLTTPIAPSAFVPRKRPTMILSISIPSVAVSAVRMDTSTKDR